jgi:molecular chaperone DnaK
MSGRLAIDFGTSNTVIAVWDEAQQEGIPFHIPDYGYFHQQGDEQFSVVPSLINYAQDRRRWIGGQVFQHDLYDSDHTFRWMKRYISNRSPVKLRVDGKEVSHFDAGKDFLSAVLLFAAEELNLGDEEIALTVPVESFEHYEDWLTDVAEAVGMPRFRIIDEPSAAALGYGAHIQPGDVYLIFDFGGGTLDVSVVLIEEEEGSQGGRRCRVLGKAGVEIGGMVIDQWIFQEILRQNGRQDYDDDVRQLSRELLVECERIKERLSTHEKAEARVENSKTATVLSAEFTRSQLEALMDDHDTFTLIDQVIRRALKRAYERGYYEEHVKAVLMVGGSSQIPSVHQLLRRIFGKDRVMLNRPLDAVARGAAAFVAGVDFYDHIQHDYAIRYVNREKGGYDYRKLVNRGTPYPTSKPVDTFTVKATYDGQTQLGIALFEMGERRQRSSGQTMELVFDPSGAARITSVSPDDEDRRTYFWMNEHNPTFLSAEPAAKQGEARFEVVFNIDGNKRLLITTRDLQTGQTMYRDYPVVKLT